MHILTTFTILFSQAIFVPLGEDGRDVNLEILRPPRGFHRPGQNRRIRGRYNPDRCEQEAYRASMRAQLPPNFQLLEGPLEVVVYFAYCSPRRQRQYGGRTDLDNLLKFILDAMNRVVYIDDRQVCSISAQKRFGLRDRTTITIRPLL